MYVFTVALQHMFRQQEKETPSQPQGRSTGACLTFKHSSSTLLLDGLHHSLPMVLHLLRLRLLEVPLCFPLRLSLEERLMRSLLSLAASAPLKVRCLVGLALLLGSSFGGKALNSTVPDLLYLKGLPARKRSRASLSVMKHAAGLWTWWQVSQVGKVVTGAGVVSGVVGAEERGIFLATIVQAWSMLVDGSG